MRLSACRQGRIETAQPRRKGVRTLACPEASAEKGQGASLGLPVFLPSRDRSDSLHTQSRVRCQQVLRLHPQ